MRKTRNLFILVGNPQDLMSVLEVLHFKGLVTNPYWNNVTDYMIEETFKYNKSIVCAAEDYTGKLQKDAIIISVFSILPLPSQKDSRTIYLSDNISADAQFEKIVQNLGLDIGDHQSNSSGLAGGQSIKNCTYCRYLTGNTYPYEKILYKSQNFFVIPTLGQFIPGYLLIIPKQHLMSNGELDIALLQEFETVLEDIEYILKLAYPSSKSLLVWENGSGKCGIGKAKDSLVHSHVHIAPTRLTSKTIAQISGFPFEEIELCNLPYYKEHSYLLIRTPEKDKWNINNDPKLYIPRQYIRQLIAEEYNIPDDGWNWRTNPFINIMYETAATITATLQENKNSLSDRIRQNTSFLF